MQSGFLPLFCLWTLISTLISCIHLSRNGIVYISEPISFCGSFKGVIRMICPQCGNDNPSKLKFCVNCGMNLENPSEVNYEQVDMGGYHAEEDSDSGKFSLGSGTFTISDNAQVSDMSSDLYTAEELNDDDEEFDFSSFDEPFIPKLDTDRLSLPGASSMRPAAGAPQMGGMPQQNMTGAPQMGGMPQQNMAGAPQMGGMPQQNMAGAPQMSGMPQQNMAGAPQMGGMPQQNGMPFYGQPMMYPQPQIVGYDQNGMPIYGQPAMYPQPQIVGYDQNGMPVYGQPMMYPQPQIVGYDQNGMPIYGQPAMYPQPQIVGYDQNGMPFYGQPAMYAQPAMPPQPDPMSHMGGIPQQPAAGVPQMGGVPQMSGIPQMNSIPQMGGIPPYGAAQQSPQQKDSGRVDVPDDFWKFFDGGKSHNPEKDSDNDFFGRTGNEFTDASARKKSANKHYMSDTPLVDADKLSPNTSSKYNSLLMRKTDVVNADDLEAHDDTKKQDIMGVTREVDAELLNSYEHFKSRISMGDAGEADAENLEAYVPEHQEAIMSQNIDAVEALPKKKTTYNDEIDSIELPEHMQARKTTAVETPEIPGLPEM